MWSRKAVGGEESRSLTEFTYVPSAHKCQEPHRGDGGRVPGPLPMRKPDGHTAGLKRVEHKKYIKHRICHPVTMSGGGIL